MPAVRRVSGANNGPTRRVAMFERILQRLSKRPA